MGPKQDALHELKVLRSQADELRRELKMLAFEAEEICGEIGMVTEISMEKLIWSEKRIQNIYVFGSWGSFFEDYYWS